MNLLWIMTDQLQAGCLGYMGHPVVRTPHLDRLAKRSFLFRNAFVQSPVCMASRASMLTGRYPSTLGVYAMGILPPEEVTLAETLQRSGCRTGLFGKLHLTPQLYTRRTLHSDVPIADWRRFREAAGLRPIPDDPAKENYGFEEIVECDDTNKGLYEHWLASQEPPVRPAEIHKLYHEAIADLYVSPVPSQWHHSTFIADRTRDFIARHRGDDAPWFACCSFIHPHHPFEAPADQIGKYAAEEIPLPDPMFGRPSAADVHPRVAKALDEFTRLPEEGRRTLLRHYYAQISLIDDCVGSLLQSLEETGQMEDTLIVFTSDHGEFSGSRGLLRKPSLHYDELLRVPLLVHVPGRPHRQIDGLVELIDLHPTLLGLLGGESHPGVQGRDWSGALLAGGEVGRADIHCEMHDLPNGPYVDVQTLRTRDWKLNVYPSATAEQGQLFDLKADPGETVNLYRDPAHREIRETLLWRLLQRKAQQRDPLPRLLSQY